MAPWPRHSVASDSQNNCIFSGNFLGAPDFGEGAIPASSGRDWYLAKYTPDNALLVARTYGDTNDQQTLRTATAPDDSIYLAGNTSTDVGFGGGDIRDIVLVKLTP